MGTTPIYGWPYPDPTDLVRDGAQAIEDLADAAETTVAGIPIVRTGTDASQVRVGDDGRVSIADVTAPSPVVRPVPFAVENGTIADSSVPGAGTTATTLTFASGRFTVAPSVVATLRTTETNTTRVASFSITVHTISSTGATVVRLNADGTARSFGAEWIAVQTER
jgi:hypothetical protein